MRFAGMLFGVAPLALGALLVTGTAAADVGKKETSGTGKGIIGGALLGGELVCSVEAVAGVKSPWAYVGGAVGGAAAGGVGGYFVEHAHGSPRVPLLMLAGGMTLLIPTIVGVLSATAYKPPADYLTDRPPADEPVANPPQPDAPSAAPAPASSPAPAPAAAPAATPPAATPPAAAPAAPTSSRGGSHPRVASKRHLPPLDLTPPALVALRPGALAFSVPAVEIQNTYTRAELAMYGVTQATEVHIPVVSVLF